MVKGTITSKQGFYVGDICYQMSEDDYYGEWSNDFNDFEGIHEIRGHRFAVDGTAYGDGYYYDQHGNGYGVDAGNIGVLPLELCKDKTEKELNKDGRYIQAATAYYEAEDGLFTIRFDTGEYIEIDTGDMAEDDDEGYYDESEDYYDEDDE